MNAGGDSIIKESDQIQFTAAQPWMSSCPRLSQRGQLDPVCWYCP